LNEYLKAQNKTNEMILTNNFTNDELSRFSSSDFRWADSRTKQFRHRTIRKGEIYQFEFGKNYKPEMSYEHRGLVIGVKQKLCYVLPIFSYDSAKHLDVYHPTDNPTSKSDLFLLKSDEFSFINHNSVLKLNDLRTVSVNRILYQQSGIIAPDSDTYKQIERLAFQKYFPSFYYDFNQLLQKISLLEEQQKENDAALKALTIENEELKKHIETLQSSIEETI
jgi:hypothetical protein